MHFCSVGLGVGSMDQVTHTIQHLPYYQLSLSVFTQMLNMKCGGPKHCLCALHEHFHRSESTELSLISLSIELLWLHPFTEVSLECIVFEKATFHIILKFHLCYALLFLALVMGTWTINKTRNIRLSEDVKRGSKRGGKYWFLWLVTTWWWVRMSHLIVCGQ